VQALPPPSAGAAAAALVPADAETSMWLLTLLLHWAGGHAGGSAAADNADVSTSASAAAAAALDGSPVALRGATALLTSTPNIALRSFAASLASALVRRWIGGAAPPPAWLLSAGGARTLALLDAAAGMSARTLVEAEREAGRMFFSRQLAALLDAAVQARRIRRALAMSGTRWAGAAALFLVPPPEAAAAEPADFAWSAGAGAGEGAAGSLCAALPLELLEVHTNSARVRVCLPRALETAAARAEGALVVSLRARLATSRAWQARDAAAGAAVGAAAGAAAGATFALSRPGSAAIDESLVDAMDALHFASFDGGARDVAARDAWQTVWRGTLRARRGAAAPPPPPASGTEGVADDFAATPDVALEITVTDLFAGCA
jgi:hypothetical protein